ncbi:MAG: hypothetical protein K6G63_06470 [Eubacterium sp.]|nr:hypothetical protein [Eubacterium sp.]
MKFNSSKIFCKAVLLMLICLTGFAIDSSISKAEGAKIELSMSAPKVQVGKEVTVICTITSDEPISETEFTVAYTPGVLAFVEGGTNVSGGNGYLSVKSDDGGEGLLRKTFSFKFKGYAKGSTEISLYGNCDVYNEAGEKMSVSANTTSVEVVAVNESVETPNPKSTMVPAQQVKMVKLSKNNKLKYLHANCVSMTPKFNNNTKHYNVTVDCNTDYLYLNYETAQSKATVSFKGNTELAPGVNHQKMIVKSQSGEKRVFEFDIIKESENDTEVRKIKEAGAKNIEFTVIEKAGRVYVKNQYQFEVVSVTDEDILPSGYVKTNIELDGRSVTAYTMENDLGNNYLLMYLKYEGGEPTLYQFDRQEKTLQRYTGTMTEKVNKGIQEQQKTIFTNTTLYAIIVGLVILVLVLVITLINMIIKKRVGKGKRELDDTDF